MNNEICFVCKKPMGNSFQRFLDKPCHSKHLNRKFIGFQEVECKLNQEAIIIIARSKEENK